MLSASLNKTFSSFLHPRFTFQVVVYQIAWFGLKFAVHPTFDTALYKILNAIGDIWEVLKYFHPWCVCRLKHSIYQFLFQPVLNDWCNKGHGMCYPVCRMVHIKEPLLLIGKSSPYRAAGFLFRYLNGPLPYVWCHITIIKCVECILSCINCSPKCYCLSVGFYLVVWTYYSVVHIFSFVSANAIKRY